MWPHFRVATMLFMCFFAPCAMRSFLIGGAWIQVRWLCWSGVSDHYRFLWVFLLLVIFPKYFECVLYIAYLLMETRSVVLVSSNTPHNSIHISILTWRSIWKHHPKWMSFFTVHNTTIYHRLKRTLCNRKGSICKDPTVEINSVPLIFCMVWVIFIGGMSSIWGIIGNAKWYCYNI
jgi:hypothetical protein